MVAMPMTAKQQVVARSGGRLFGLWSLFMLIRRKECRVGGDGEAETVKGEELARGSVKGVDGDGEDGR
eukprot:7138074-Prymnesium_polylepis.1